MIKAPRFNIGLIGCGYMGNRRAQNLGMQGQLYACADKDIKKAQALAQAYEAHLFSDWNDLIRCAHVDIVLIATPHDLLAPIARVALESGKHVFIEKPGARTPSELGSLHALTEKKAVKVRVGFNHRYHPALMKARDLVDSGALGELMFLRGRYGHGGRLGYEQEWRSNPAISGGGHLMDQGPHMIDLARWFLGEFSDVHGSAQTYFWNMPVEDNAFLILKTEEKKTAFLHVSCTEWKNLFSFEIYGKKGKIDICGLGGSYGPETLTWYAMSSAMGLPRVQTWNYPAPDISWQCEMEDFYCDILNNRSPSAGLTDAYAALKIVHAVYKDSGYDYCTQSA
jgi:predicted dehydrogenase